MRLRAAKSLQSDKGSQFYELKPIGSRVLYAKRTSYWETGRLCDAS